jgi:hypothetical protein
MLPQEREELEARHLNPQIPHRKTHNNNNNN